MFNLYTMALGDTGIIKVGYTNDLKRRAGEHGRKYGCPKQVRVLSSASFTSKATIEKLENDLIKACVDAGLEMVIDSQNGRTERFYMNSDIAEVTITVRKKTYSLKVSE